MPVAGVERAWQGHIYPVLFTDALMGVHYLDPMAKGDKQEEKNFHPLFIT